MERASKLLREYRFANRCLTSEQLVQAAWPDAVGKRVARHSRVANLWNGQLRIAVEDDIWRTQLTPLAGQILGRLCKLLGDGLVTSIEFRVGVPRRGPARADSPVEIAPDQDGIADPVLGRIYRASKQRQRA